MLPTINIYREGGREWDGDCPWNPGRLLNYHRVTTKI